MHANKYGERRVGARELSEDASVACVGEAESPVFLGDCEAEKTGTREGAYDVLADGLLLVETLRIDESIVLHRPQIVDEPTNDACLRGITFLERRWKREEKGVVQRTGENSTNERRHESAS